MIRQDSVKGVLPFLLFDSKSNKYFPKEKKRKKKAIPKSGEGKKQGFGLAGVGAGLVF